MMLPNGQQANSVSEFVGRIDKCIPCQVHPAVEALIIRYGLDAQCAQQLRQLPLPLQAVVFTFLGSSNSCFDDLVHD